jgi:hypothetical protein
MLPDEPGQDQATAHPVAPEREEGDQTAGVLHRVSRRARRVRSWFHARPGGQQIWRAGVAVGLLALTGVAVGA